jgi:hypothetical protein
MKIFDNPILSRMFKHNGLILNQDGLYLRVDTRFRYYKILISNNGVKVAHMIGLDALSVQTADEVEFFEMLIENEFFNLEKFKDDVSEGSSRLMALFADFLNERQIVNTTPVKKINTPMLLSYFSNERDFLQRYNKALAVKQIDKKVNLDGRKMLLARPNLSREKMPTYIANFRESLGDCLEHDYFMSVNSDKDIFKHFLKVVALS